MGISGVEAEIGVPFGDGGWHDGGGGGPNEPFCNRTEKWSVRTHGSSASDRPPRSTRTRKTTKSVGETSLDLDLREEEWETDRRVGPRSTDPREKK